MTQQDKDTVLLIGDGATAHQDQIVQKRDIVWQKLTTACPEWNPAERFFEELRKYTANQVFEQIQSLEQLIEKLVNEFMCNPTAVKKLTLYNYLNT